MVFPHTNLSWTGELGKDLSCRSGQGFRLRIKSRTCTCSGIKIEAGEIAEAIDFVFCVECGGHSVWLKTFPSSSKSHSETDHAHHDRNVVVRRSTQKICGDKMKPRNNWTPLEHYRNTIYFCFHLKIKASIIHFVMKCFVLLIHE